MEGTKIAKSDHGNTSAIADPAANTNTKDFQSPNKNIEPGFMGQAQMEKYLSQINFKTIDSQQSLQLAIKILKNRDNQDEISALETEALLVATKNMDFFEEMNKVEVNKQLSIHQRCCRVMQYQKLPKGSVVFEAGSRPDKLYIILTGSVNVFVPKTKEQIQKEILLVNRIARKTMESQTGKDNKRRRGVFLHNNQPSQGTKFAEVEISMKQKAYNVKIARKKLFTQSDSEGSSSSDDGSDIEVESIADDNQNADDEEEQDDGNDEEEADTGKNPGSLLEKLFGGINPEYIEDLNRYLTKGVFHLLYESTVEAGFVFGELGLTKQSLRQRTIICKEDCQFATISRENFSEILNLLKERRRRDKVNFVELNMIPDANREANERVAGMMKKMRAIKGQKIYQEGDSAEKVYLIREGEVTMYVKKGASQRAKEELWNKYNEVSAYLKKPMADNLKLVAVAKLNAGQYFGEEDMLEYNPRKLTAICTTLKAKLYTINRRVQRFFKNFHLCSLGFDVLL